MTSPQSPYPHGTHGPGPSYYHQPPPVYGGSSPGGNPHYGYQQYPPPPPPHMNSHHPGPSRPNGRGGGPYNPRNQNPNPYNYYQPYGHHPGPVPMHPPNPHPYPRTQPYSPAYAYLNPAAPAFTPPPRHTPQPMSPSPAKRPAIPQQAPVSPAGFYEPTDFVASSPQLSAPIPLVSPRAQKLSAPLQVEAPPASEPFDPPSEAVEATPSPRSPAPPAHEPAATEGTSESEPEPAPSSPALEPSTNAAQSPAYNQMGSIHTQESSTTDASSATPESPTDSSSSHPMISFAIWSRRPRDPTNAPGIIISPKACPPQNVVEGASDTKTPPISPPSSPRVPKKKLAPSASRDSTHLDSLYSQTSSTVPSSAATENADTPTIPGSPATTNTSVSTSGLATAVESKLQSEELKEAPKEASQDAVPEAIKPAASSVDEPPTSSATDAAPVSSDDKKDRADAAPQSSPAAEAEPSAPAAPATPAPPPIKKSWASLLRPTGSAAASAAAKNALPTSSIVGFSIPADAVSGTGQHVSPTKKSELVTLLMSNPPSAASIPKVRSRGLVNSGNMCFANSVLQILVYCPPFHRLFVELGKLLPAVNAAEKAEKEAGVWAGPPSSTASASASAPSTKVSSVTPLVDATALFLKEFSAEKKEKKGVANGKNGAAASGSGGYTYGGYGRGKGKERDFADLDDDDWDMDSFLPTYIYDAMKEKKRFDTMRGGQQEDAEEFLGFYLDTLEEELLLLLNSINAEQASKPTVEEKEAPATKEEGWMEVGKKNRMVVTRTIKANESPITRIFGGKFRSTLRAPRQKDSVVIEDWRSLRLDIQRDEIRTIQEALSYISAPSHVQVSIPTQPGVPVEATQQVLIESLPPILVLHIKRFCYDINVKGVVKVGKQVAFGPELDIGSELMAPAAKKIGPTRYKLFGALYHHGQSASGGHYTLDVLHPNRYPNAAVGRPKEGWVRIDDDLVSDVRHEDVFGAAQERDDGRSAYLLFYRKV